MLDPILLAANKKVLEDAMMASKSLNTRIRRIKKVAMIEKEKNLEFIEIYMDKDIDSDATAIEKTR